MFCLNCIFKLGDVILGGLFDVYINGLNDNCSIELFMMGFGYVEVMIFVIECINNDFSILLNVIIGYDICDYCENVGMVMMMVYDVVKSIDFFC